MDFTFQQISLACLLITNLDTAENKKHIEKRNIYMAFTMIKYCENGLKDINGFFMLYIWS